MNTLETFVRSKTGKMSGELALLPGGMGLGKLPATIKPDQTTTMICGFCSTGCGLNIHLRNGEAVNLTPTTEYPVNLGMACPKGWEALAPLSAPDRAVAPLLKDDNGFLQRVTWDHAVERFLTKFREIHEAHGPDALGWLGTGQITNEELAFLGALAKFGLGFAHGDGNTRQCMATAVVAYKEAFGFDAPPFTYADLEASDTIILVGSNLAIAHPILWQRVLRNPNHPRIVCIDPRRTETAQSSTWHLPLRPKSDLTLLYGLANILVQEGWVDLDFIRNHTTGFNECVNFLETFTPEKVAAQSGIPASDLRQLAQWVHEGKAVSFWWTMGVNQSHEAVRTAQAIINVALMTGNIGRPGTGANSITGQCNAMGSRLFSNTTNLIGGYDFEKSADRRHVAGILGIPVRAVPDHNSRSYDRIIDSIEEGRIKGLWVVATNGAHSWIQQDRYREIVKKLDFFVVQDMYHSTETAVMADLMLPAAGWGEKEGTFINSERRIGLVKKVAKAPGEALSDFNIFKLIAGKSDRAQWFRDWKDPESVFQILKKCSVGQPCDISGIADYHMLDEAGGVQWPWPADAVGSKEWPVQERRLFSDGRFFTPDEKARFLFESPRAPGEISDADYPMILLTGRATSAQWHTETRTGKSDILRMLSPRKVYAEIHPATARAKGIVNGQTFQIESRRAVVKAQAVVTATIQPGQIFMPMHYPETNRLTFSEFDPYSRQPSYKHCAVRIQSLPL